MNTRSSESAKRRWNTIELVGRRFGQWTILERNGSNNSGQKLWLCQCDCGTIRLIVGHTLKIGRSKSCGCVGVPSGAAHHSWKGGRRKSGAGYIVLANGKLEHRDVMERILGRQLYSDETVHHKNGIRNDNDPHNLELHASAHGVGQTIPDLVLWATEILRRYQPDALR